MGRVGTGEQVEEGGVKALNRLRGVVAFFVWVKEYFKLTFHTMKVWDAPSGAGKEDVREWQERNETGPMRYEFERVERLKKRAERLLNREAE